MSLEQTLMMRDNYDERVVSPLEKLPNGLEVSTAYTYDEGYETAIIDARGIVYPVERYLTKDDSVVGHDRWIEFAKDGIDKTITVLGCYEDNWETRQITL